MFENSNVNNKTTPSIKNNKKLILQEGMITKFWYSQDREIASVLKAMDSKEDSWCVSKDPTIVSELDTLAKHFKDSKIPDDKMYTNRQQEGIITVLAYLNSSWAFRILKYLDDYRNPVLMKLTLYALVKVKSTDESYEYISPEELYIDRMITLKKMHLVSRIFDVNRQSQINKLLDTMEKIIYGDVD